jgi:hypothetical protein
MVKVRIIFDLPTYYVQYIEGPCQSRDGIAHHALTHVALLQQLPSCLNCHIVDRRQA